MIYEIATQRPGQSIKAPGSFVRQLLSSSPSSSIPLQHLRDFSERERGSTQCFVYMFHKKCKSYDVYVCRGCKKEQLHNQIEVCVHTNLDTNTKMNCEIQVVGDQFQSDPCRRSHACVSVNVLGDKVERRAHQFDIYFVALRKYLLQKCSEIRKDPRYRKLTTTEILEDMLEEYEADGTMRAEDRQEMMLSFHRGNLNSIRSAIAKYFADMLYFVIMAQAYHKVKGITWDNIPQSLSHLRDGTQFLQLRTPQLQLYYSLKTIEKAYHNGLCVSVADGVHKIMPEKLGDHSQLYTIHSVCNNGLEVPLFHALTKNKTEAMYKTIFEHIRQVLVTLGWGAHVAVGCGFVMAVIRAAKAVILGITVEGCAFHLAQAWNRKREILGLKRFLKGPQRSRAVLKWWRSIKGLAFLPKHLHRRVPGLYRPSFPSTHEAYQKCVQFLAYLHSTWLRGPYAELWCKWGMNELRTTNLAEAYHSKLRRVLKKKNVDLDALLKRVRAANTRAFADLCALERMPDEERRLRKRDRDRRLKIAAEMRRFERVMERPCILTSTIIKYCRRMSQFVSEKTI
ncbi:hypothetical protein COOONC_01839 [Cooperia oncophora]